MSGALEGVLFDVRLALRGLRRDRAFAITTIATLAVALALNVTVFTVMDAMLFRGLPLAARSDRLLFLRMRKPSDLPCCAGPVLYADVAAWRAQSRAFQDLAFGGSDPITFRDGDGRPLDMTVSRNSANTFGLLGVRPALGRDFVHADELPGAPPVAIISDAFWERRFGKRADVVGLTVHVNGAATSIIGVMPEGFVLVSEQDLWMTLLPTPALEGGAIGRLRDGATQEEARAELETFTRRLQAADSATLRGVPSVQTYTQRHVAPDAPMIYGSIWAGSWLVLLVAGANLANLTMVRTIERWRELATKIALGAGQARMVRQMLIESLMLTAAAGALGWWLTAWSVRAWAEATRSIYLALDYSITFGTLAYLMAIALAAGIVVSLVPVIRVLRLGANGALKGDARGTTQGLRVRHLTSGLVASQMALSIVLLMGAGVLIRSLENIVGADTGVRDPEHVMASLLRLPSDKYPTAATRAAYFDRLQTQLRTVAGTEAISVASTLPTRVVNRRGVEIEGRAADAGEFAQFLTVDRAYFDVMGRPPIDGRDFNARDDAAASPVVIVNQSFADAFFPGRQPVGQRLRTVDRNTPGPWRTVVGVVPNIMQGDATRQTFRPVAYIPFRQQPSASAYLFLRTSVPPNQIASAVRTELRELDPDVLAEDVSPLPARLAFDRDFMDLEHAELGKHAGVAPIFAVLALLLAATGLYAMVAHSVTQRTKEIGIRMAIGAAGADIRRMVLRQGLLPVWMGLLVGLTAGIAVNRVLQSQLVGVSPVRPRHDDRGAAAAGRDRRARVPASRASCARRRASDRVEARIGGPGACHPL